MTMATGTPFNWVEDLGWLTENEARWFHSDDDTALRGTPDHGWRPFHAVSKHWPYERDTPDDRWTPSAIYGTDGICRLGWPINGREIRPRYDREFLENQ